MKELEVTFEEIFNAVSEIEGHTFINNVEYIQDSIIEIMDENNQWCNVLGLIKKYEDTKQITWSNGTETNCANGHLIRTTDTVCKRAEDFIQGDSIADSNNTTLYCKSVVNTGKKNVFDLHIDSENHLYQTADGIVHHNTLLAKTIARLLKVPFYIADATSITEAGYVGDDVESILSGLLQSAEGNIEAAQRGIVFLDEVDKKAGKSDSPSVTRDVSGEGVQQALLRMIEGSVCRVPAAGGRKHPQQEMVEIDTTNILFFVSGAFVNLDKIIESRLYRDQSSIGIGAKIRSQDSKRNIFDLLKHTEPEDLIKFGLIPELIGRLPVIAPLAELTEPQLVQVLTEPKNAIVKQFKAMFKLKKVELDINENGLTEIAKTAIKKKTGARGLRNVLEHKLIPVQFELPELSQQGLKKVEVDEEVIQGLKEPVRIFEPKVDEI